MASEILLEERSPHGNADAIVEDDGRVVYLYLRFHEDTERHLRSVWIRNRAAAPPRLDVAGMREGLPPLMPEGNCAHPRGAKRLAADSLRLTWLPEGDGVALYEGHDLLAAIVPWSGIKGFHGYARDAIGEGPVAWQLLADNRVRERFASAQAWWESWESDARWERLRDESIARYEAAFGSHTRYFAIDGGNWPPKALVWIPWRDTTLLLTVGVCVRPQPTVEMVVDDPRALRRIELGAIIPKALGEDATKKASGVLSGLAEYAWAWNTWLGHGHTLDIDLLGDPRRPAVILADGARSGPRFQPASWDGDPVTLLWVAPITSEELARKEAEGAAAVLPAVLGRRNE